MNESFLRLQPRRCFMWTMIFALTVILSAAGNVQVMAADSAAPALTAEDRALFAKADFTTVTQTKSIPSQVASKLGLEGSKKSMADAGEPWNSGCVGPATLPHQRLIFAGTAPGLCIVYFERGGIALFNVLQIYKLSGNKATLICQTNGNKSYKTIAEIKEAMAKDELR